MIQSKSESKITKVITVSGNESVTVLDLPAQKDLLLEMLENLSSETKFEDYVFVRKGYGYKKVKVLDLVCLEAQQNYCNLFMVDGSKLTVTMPMNEVCEYFDPKLFKRIHRSFVVNLEHVDSYEGNMLVLDNGRAITIGRNYREQIAKEFNGKKLKYYRIDEEISKHVKGVTKGKFHFYYSLGHLVDNAVVDMKFANSGDIDGDWKTRGNHANTGVSGDVKNRYLCIKTKNVKNGVPRSEFVTGFGVKVDGKVKSISKYTETSYTWKQNGDNWYKGLVHDDVYCIYTKDKLKDF